MSPYPGHSSIICQLTLGKIERYLRQTGMPRTKFGRLAVNDPRLVDDLRNGRDPGPELCARIEAQLARAPAVVAQEAGR